MNRQESRIWSFQSLLWFVRLGVVVLLLVFAILIDSTATRQHRNDVRQQWQENLDGLRVELQSRILQNIATVWGLAANVAVQPEINQERFDELASVIFSLAPELRNIGLAPDYVIRFIYPLEGNEPALGLDISKQSLSDADIRMLHDSRSVVFSGPINLVQGGTGLAGRVPVYRRDSGDFWGVVSVIMDLEKLYTVTGIANRNSSRTLILSRSESPADTQARFFVRGDSLADNPVSSQLSLTGVKWTLFAAPATGWPGHPESPWLFRGLLGIGVVLLAGGVFWLTHIMMREQNMQRRFWGLFELAPVGIALYDGRSGKQLRANPEHRLSFGNQAFELGFFDQIRDDETTPASTLGLQKRLNDKGYFRSLEGFLPSAENHQPHPFKLHGLVFRDTHQSPVVWIISEDISESRKVERMKNEFVSTVSHELRTPLTSISGALGLLEGQIAGILPDNAQRLIHIAYRNSKHLTLLINDLLDIEKLIAGEMTLRPEALNLADLLDVAVENIAAFAEERGVRLNAECPPTLLVRVDRLRFAQCLSNLLSNAIKFSPTGSEIQVFTRRNGQRLTVCVQDQGEGIPEEFRDRIFGKFSQADGTDRRQTGGTGLGLAITRELMERMDGSVGFSSIPGHGALFWLDVPVVQADFNISRTT